MSFDRDKAQAFIDDPGSRYVVPRYHNTSDPFYIKQRECNGVSSVQGRGRCSECGHQVFFTPSTNIQLQSVAKLCAQCALGQAGADLQVYMRLHDELSHCPALSARECPYGPTA